MSYSKRQLVEKAYSAIGLASYVFDLTPDQIVSAVEMLDAMMAQWDAKGIRVGYALASDPSSTDPDQDSGLPSGAVETVYANLGIRLATTIGKVVSVELRTIAKEGYNTLLARAALPNEVQIKSMPRGQGAKNTDDPFTNEPVEPLHTGTDNQFDFY